MNTSPSPIALNQRQNADGTPHLTYFNVEHLLSFCWDGISEVIQVSHGGYGEPVTHVISIPDGVKGHRHAMNLMQAFKDRCELYITSNYGGPTP